VFGRSWQPGSATIVASRDAKVSGDGLVTVREFVADVRSDDGATAFRTVLKEPRIATDFWRPNDGDTVRVQIDARRQQARFDTSDPALSARARRAAQDADWDAIARGGA
jgi:hypothetical protein